MSATCDCLTAFDASLPHYVHCAAGGGENTDIRFLAELASFRDIDGALSALRSLTAGVR
jgi:hypothetical protein